MAQALRRRAAARRPFILSTSKNRGTFTEIKLRSLMKANYVSKTDLDCKYCAAKLFPTTHALKLSLTYINKYPRLSWSSAVSGGSCSGKRKQSRTEAPCTLVFQIPLEDVFRFGAPLGHGHVLRNRRKYSSRNLPICESCFEEHPSVNVCAGIYPICVGEDLSISFCFALSSVSPRSL